MSKIEINQAATSNTDAADYLFKKISREKLEEKTEKPKGKRALFRLQTGITKAKSISG